MVCTVADLRDTLVLTDGQMNNFCNQYQQISTSVKCSFPLSEGFPGNRHECVCLDCLIEMKAIIFVPVNRHIST